MVGTCLATGGVGIRRGYVAAVTTRASARWAHGEAPRATMAAMTTSPDTSPTLQSVAWDDPRAVRLRAVMDAEMLALYIRPDDPPDPPGAFEKRKSALDVEAQDVLATVLALAPDGTAVGHAVLRDLRGEWEVKKVIVDAPARGQGVAKALMARLEAIARAGGASRLILHTGNRQPEAVALYEQLGYTPIPLYAPYAEAMPASLCYELVLS